jgi:hypothetical protein
MRSVDLAVYADTLAGEVAALSARLERARTRLREAAIEQEARRVLPRQAVVRLEALGLLTTCVTERDTAEIADVQASLAALQQLQEWVERELAAASDRGGPSAPDRVRPTTRIEAGSHPAF